MTQFVVSCNDEHHNGFVPVGVGCSYRQYKRITVYDISISVQLDAFFSIGRVLLVD